MALEWWDFVLWLIGAFGFGWGLAERSNRKSLQDLDSRISRLAKIEQIEREKRRQS